MRTGTGHFTRRGDEFRSICRAVQGELGAPSYVWGGRVHFRLDSAWSLSLSRDSMGRLRLDMWRGRRLCASLWALPGDWDRLADLARGAKAEVAALAA